MATTVTVICRYPVKGLSAEKMDRVVLMPGECLPHDRRFAIALGSTPFDPQRPEWLPKTHFIMLMRDESLARLCTRFDAATGLLSIAEQDPRGGFFYITRKAWLDLGLPSRDREGRKIRFYDGI